MTTQTLTRPRKSRKKLKDLLFADLFCGAGWTSTGAEKAVKELERKVILT